MSVFAPFPSSPVFTLSFGSFVVFVDLVEHIPGREDFEAAEYDHLRAGCWLSVRDKDR
jgi:hypothetical protein